MFHIWDLCAFSWDFSRNCGQHCTRASTASQSPALARRLSEQIEAEGDEAVVNEPPIEPNRRMLAQADLVRRAPATGRAHQRLHARTKLGHVGSSLRSRGDLRVRFFWTLRNPMLFLGNIFSSPHFVGRQTKEAVMKRRVDREKIERADRESKLVLDAERKAREAKTARLREQRLLLEASTSPPSHPGRMKLGRRQPTRKIIVVD